MKKNPWTIAKKINAENRPFFILAPMEAVTDTIFRQVIKKSCPSDIWFSEFTNATGWVHAGEKAIGGRLFKEDFEEPIVAQIWGGEPNDMKELALHCRELGFNGIDINMGCPAKSAIKSGGAALIRHPKLAAESINYAKSAGLPVSVKTRLGYSKIDEWKDWLKHILNQDIENLTIHLRTKKEMSKVPAHFELIDEITKLRDDINKNTLITINGDILNKKQGLEIYESHPGINGIMIGRGIFQNPYAFSINSDSLVNRESLLNLLKLHLDLFDKYQPITNRPYETIKRFFKIYVRDFDGAKEMRDKLMNTKSTDEAREIIK